ncbi:MAG: N-acetyl-alpha-D-glucosaminyl L-malate synthase BshA [Gemmatimonadota bacterium]
MKIGITCYPTYGGSGALATELGLDLARRGHEVHFITYAMPFRLRGYTERVYFHEVDTVTGRYPLFDHYPYTLALASKQHEVALREKLEVLHVHYAIPHALTAWLAREMLGARHPIKVITTLHGTDITLVGQEANFHAITKFSIERSDSVTAVSQFLKDETIRTFGCTNCGIRVIPNFVNVAEYRPAKSPAAEAIAPADHKIITHVSNFREVKRVRDVVRVFARIRKALPATLLMVGDGPDRDDAEREARDLGVDADVRFLGRLGAVAPLLQASDLFLLPSQSESFGLAALEAMACGAPVVGARAGGMPEVIIDGVTGILEPAGSVEAMGRRAVELLRDPARLAEMSLAATERAKEFAADRIVPMYEKLYHEVAGR